MCNIATVSIVWISIRWFIICLFSASIYTPVIYDSLNSIAAKFEVVAAKFRSCLIYCNLCIRLTWLGRIG